MMAFFDTLVNRAEARVDVPLTNKKNKKDEWISSPKATDEQVCLYTLPARIICLLDDKGFYISARTRNFITLQTKWVKLQRSCCAGLTLPEGCSFQLPPCS